MTGFVSRRKVLSVAMIGGGAATLGLLNAGAARAQGQAQAGGAGTAPAQVDEKDSLAVALGYVSEAKRVDPKANPTYQTSASCATCSWYQGKSGDAGGPCTFFPGKHVNAHGWCRMWAQKK